MILTLGDARATVARVLGKASTSDSVREFINEAVKRLIVRGNWVGTVVRYRCCVREAKLTWPRHIHTILKCNVDDSTVMMANKWYEFMEAGPGTLYDDDDPGLILQDMGMACSFDDFAGEDKVAVVQSSEAESSDSYLCIQGYDDSNAWVRTTHPVTGDLVDGEYVLITPVATYSTTEWRNLARVIKPATNGSVYLGEYDTVLHVTKPLGVYEPDETRPWYRRSRIPSLDTYADESDCELCATGYANVNVVAKKKHITAVEDNDWLQIGNLPAIKLACMAVDKEEKNLFNEARAYLEAAIEELEKELKDHNQGAAVPTHDVIDPSIFGAGTIESVVGG